MAATAPIGCLSARLIRASPGCRAGDCCRVHRTGGSGSRSARSYQGAGEPQLRDAVPSTGAENPMSGHEEPDAQRNRKRRRRSRPINPVTHDTVADFGKMNSNLMRPASLEPARDQSGRVAEVLDRFVVRDRHPTRSPLVRLTSAAGGLLELWILDFGFSLRIVSARRTPAAVASVGHNRQIDRSSFWLHLALDHSQIAPLD